MAPTQPRDPKSAHPTVAIGVVGYGYWGPNLARNFAELDGARLVAVSDLGLDRLAQVRRRYPSVHTTADYRDLFRDPAIDAVAIATPVSTHFALALEALRAGKHVLVEKPLATTSAEASRLIDEAARRQRVLMVDHTFVYTGAVQTIEQLVRSGQLGRPYYYDSTRVNLGLVQHDINVLWDLAVHDLSIMDFVLGRGPQAVSATGAAHIAGRPVSIAFLTCFFVDDLIAHIQANWLAPVKVRRTLIGGDAKMIVYDDLEPSEKVKVYDKGVSVTSSPEMVYERLVSYRTGDMWAPQLNHTEALRTEAQHFLDCITTGARPRSDGEAGRRIVRILEAATESVARGGCPVDV